MNVFSGFFSGISAYKQAFRILFSRRFSWFLLFPLLLLMLFFIGGEWLISVWGGDLAGIVQTRISDWIAGIPWLSWMNQAVGVMIQILLRIAWFFLFVTVGGYIVIILMSPVYSWLSERTETHLTGRQYPFSFRQLLREIFRGILIALRNMVFQLLITFFLFFCSFIPLIGWFSPIVLLGGSAYFYGFSFIDYAIERKRFNIKESVRYMNKNVGMVMGIGMIFAFLLMLPWIGVTLACFISLLSVIAGTVAVNNMGEKK